MSKHDIMLIIFKFYVSKIYLVVLLPNFKHTYDKINQIGKLIRALYSYD